MRKIWLTRHGESMYNTLHRLGGDSPLSPRGEVYSKKLPDVLVDRVPLVRARSPCQACAVHSACRAHLASWADIVCRHIGADRRVQKLHDPHSGKHHGSDGLCQPATIRFDIDLIAVACSR